MKRRLEPNLDTEPPCGLPGELWKQHIIPDHRTWVAMDRHFITLRSLRCACVWFARHIDIHDRRAHDHFWPNVERWAKKGRADALCALEWPTYRTVMLARYGSMNYSYGRAGAALARRGDVQTLMVMARHGGEYWTLWLVDAIKAGHVEMLKTLYTSGLRRVDSECEFGHMLPRYTAIECNRLDMLRIVDKYSIGEEPISKRYKSVAIKEHRDFALLQYIGVTPQMLQKHARSALVWHNDYAHIEYILDHYWTQRPTRGTHTRGQRLRALLTDDVLREECKYINTRTWAEGMGVVYDEIKTVT